MSKLTITEQNSIKFISPEDSFRLMEIDNFITKEIIRLYDEHRLDDSDILIKNFQLFKEILNNSDL